MSSPPVLNYFSQKYFLSMKYCIPIYGDIVPGTRSQAVNPCHDIWRLSKSQTLPGFLTLSGLIVLYIFDAFGIRKYLNIKVALFPKDISDLMLSYDIIFYLFVFSESLLSCVELLDFSRWLKWPRVQALWEVGGWRWLCRVHPPTCLTLIACHIERSERSAFNKTQNIRFYRTTIFQNTSGAL